MAQQYATGKAGTAQTFDTSAFHTRQTEGKRFYYQLEPNGAPSRLLSPDGRAVWAATYGATGKANLIQQGLYHQPLRLQNQYYDVESGLHYNLFRYYDANIGQTTSLIA